MCHAYPPSELVGDSLHTVIAVSPPRDVTLVVSVVVRQNEARVVVLLLILLVDVQPWAVNRNPAMKRKNDTAVSSRPEPCKEAQERYSRGQSTGTLQ